VSVSKWLNTQADY